MHSPPVEWVLGIGYLAALDVIRDRGEPDGDTLSEVLREVFHVGKPEGRAALAGTIMVGAVGLYLHLVKPEMR